MRPEATHLNHSIIFKCFVVFVSYAEYLISSGKATYPPFSDLSEEESDADAESEQHDEASDEKVDKRGRRRRGGSSIVRAALVCHIDELNAHYDHERHNGVIEGQRQRTDRLLEQRIRHIAHVARVVAHVWRKREQNDNIGDEHGHDHGQVDKRLDRALTMLFADHDNTADAVDVVATAAVVAVVVADVVVFTIVVKSHCYCRRRRRRRCRCRLMYG